MRLAFAGLTYRSMDLLGKIKENPTNKNIAKYIKNVCEVKNKNTFLFFKKADNDFSNYSKTHSDLLFLKHCLIHPKNNFLRLKDCHTNFSESKKSLINRAISKNLNKIIETDHAFEAFNQTIDHSKIVSVNDYLATVNTGLDNKKYKLYDSQLTMTQVLFNSEFKSSAEQFDQLIKKHDHLLKYYDSISIDESESASFKTPPSRRDSALRHAIMENFSGITLYNAKNDQCSHS